MPTQRGHLVLADISGYTAFVAQTELEHSREILNELLETLVRGLAQHLRIGQIEGDAIFALGEQMPDDPRAWLEDIFIRFHRHLNAIKRVSTCPCRACVSVGSLTLKYICHWGEYLPQSFMGKETFVGNAVNQVHRLLKNAVPSREYILASAETIERLPEPLRSMFTPHQERYDVGVVDCGWLDLSPLRSDPRTNEEVRVVDAERARLTFEHTFPASPDRLWAILMDPTARVRWMGDNVERVDYVPGARHTLVGSEYHCYHGEGERSDFRIMEAKRPAEMTAAIQLGPALVWNTMTLEQVSDGRTRLVSRYSFEAVPAEMHGIGEEMLTDYEQDVARLITRLIEGVEAAAPA
ncbi:MAG: DUF2652 domain-containing protein [Chloroflexota bacterium]